MGESKGKVEEIFQSIEQKQKEMELGEKWQENEEFQRFDI